MLHRDSLVITLDGPLRLDYLELAKYGISTSIEKCSLNMSANIVDLTSILYIYVLRGLHHLHTMLTEIC